VVLADGAAGTNYFQMGLESGEPPELWNVDHPERVQELHRAFVDAGADCGRAAMRIAAALRASDLYGRVRVGRSSAARW
jgi:methionine synthase I (cobalamin-dependent)